MRLPGQQPEDVSREDHQACPIYVPSAVNFYFATSRKKGILPSALSRCGPGLIRAMLSRNTGPAASPCPTPASDFLCIYGTSWTKTMFLKETTFCLGISQYRLLKDDFLGVFPSAESPVSLLAKGWRACASGPVGQTQLQALRGRD